MTSLAYDASPPLIDEAEVKGLLEDLGAASDVVSRSPVVPDEVRDLVAGLPARLRAETPTNALAGDPYLAETAYAGAARAAAAMLDPDERARRREVRLALEQIRQALRDIVERRPVDEDVPAERIAVWLEATLGLPQQQIADLVGTSVRTWQRWIAGTPPDAAQALRLRRIARLTMSLRHALTGPGVAGWFTRRHPLIKDGGGSPAELLADPEGYQRLLTLAAGLRSTQASQVPWETVAWRIAGWDTPLWSVPSRRAGRYNRAGDPATQYLCLHPWGPWAEVLRWDDRRTEREAAELSSRLWSVRVGLSAEPRRITFDDAPSLGIEADDLVSEDYTVCQDVADEARAAHQSALLVPSAALPGTETLVILGPRALTAWQVPPVDVEVDVPAAVTADDAGAPQAVLPHVRWRGTTHRGLADWKTGTSADFFEPTPTPLPTPVHIRV